MNKYFGNLSFKEILEDESKFNIVLDRVVSRAIERIMVNLPKIIIAQIKHGEATQALVDKFYANNRDLKKYRALVGTTVTRLHAENPGMSTDKLLEMAAEEIRSSVKNN